MDIVELLLKESEITPAQYWEAQASMWQENYKEAANEIEQLQKQLTKLDKDIEELKKTIETLEEEVYLRSNDLTHVIVGMNYKE